MESSFGDPSADSSGINEIDNLNGLSCEEVSSARMGDRLVGNKSNFDEFLDSQSSSCRKIYEKCVKHTASPLRHVEGKLMAKSAFKTNRLGERLLGTGVVPLHRECNSVLLRTK